MIVMIDFGACGVSGTRQREVSIGEIIDIDPVNRTIDIKKTKKAADLHPTAVFVNSLGPTADVMANSLVYWTQDLFFSKLLCPGARVFAMTSAGDHIVWPAYGAVSAAKSALESYVRQLAVELAPHRVAVNALRAGVTDTPALRKIPEAARMVEVTLARNPHGRLTTTQDVAEAIVSLSETDSDWISGNVIGVDGGEFVTG
jgi:NAD(P)-dependent dehydrogenase (short-subunit alcohol dehydrogenase family)